MPKLAAPLVNDGPVVDNERLVLEAILRTERKQTLIIAFLTLQTVMMLLGAMAGIYTYNQIMSRVDTFDGYVTILNDPQTFVTDPAVATTLATVLQDTAASFFLGSPNGTLATFVQDVAETPFGTIGAGVKPFAEAVANALRSKTTSSECNQPVECSMQGEMQCPNGRSRWCNNAGEVVNCADCPYGGPLEVASLVQSIASRIAQVAPVPTIAESSPAALSDGLLRLNSVLTWVGKQGSIGSWEKAATQCLKLSDVVGSVNWSGNYTGEHGDTKEWSANHEINQVREQLNRYCPIFAHLSNWTQKQQQQPQQHQQSRMKKRA